MSYSKNDGKMKEGHIHINPDGSIWIVKNQKFIKIKIIYSCEVCSIPCFAYTQNIPPNRCIRDDLDVSKKANWNIAKEIN